MNASHSVSRLRVSSRDNVPRHSKYPMKDGAGA
jgi:hypothetical protein